MLYLDTSLVVTLLTSEDETARTQSWMRQHSDETFTISDWVVTEFSAALSMKWKLQVISDDVRRKTQAWFNRLAVETFECLPVSSEHFQVATRFAERSNTGLRGGDALHLAMAAAVSATLCTRDKGLAKAGTEFSVSTILL